MSSKPEILAWSILPEPNGTNYTQADLIDESKVVDLFSSGKNLEAAILSSGWDFLFDQYGLSGLIEIDSKSKWLQDDDMGKWISNIVYTALLSGFNPSTNEYGDYDHEQSVWFRPDGTKMKIDWDEIYGLKEGLV